MGKSKGNKEDISKNLVDHEKLPSHIGIIMDGNGRWAKKRFLPRTAGHTAGAKTVRKIVEECVKLNIPYLTLYAFSKENWKRPKEEVSKLMQLLTRYLRKEINNLNENGVKIKILGDIDELPEQVQTEVKNAMVSTKDNSKLVLNLALNYGSRQEIVKAFQNIHKDIENNKLNIEDVTKELISDYLYTENQPDPDLIIRTSGEQRISNFMLYQVAYSEFDFVDVLWPDFNREDFHKSIIKFQNRSRRYGGV